VPMKAEFWYDGSINLKINGFKVKAHPCTYGYHFYFSYGFSSSVLIVDKWKSAEWMFSHIEKPTPEFIEAFKLCAKLSFRTQWKYFNDEDFTVEKLKRALKRAEAGRAGIEALYYFAKRVPEHAYQWLSIGHIKCFIYENFFSNLSERDVINGYARVLIVVDGITGKAYFESRAPIRVLKAWLNQDMKLIQKVIKQADEIEYGRVVEEVDALLHYQKIDPKTIQEILNEEDAERLLVKYAVERITDG